ncbi:hypothetical protein [Haliangium sp.]|uniref:hypothetical protein n=1 Tax=Haliangium sp. TaxID=2663208 RepID=UPI003D11238B
MAALRSCTSAPIGPAPLARWTLALSLIAALVGAGLACGGSELAAMTPLPARVTRATLTGPLCMGGETQCRCRERGESVGQPDEDGVKRYEIRIGPVANELWVSVDDMVLYKSAERGEECFYVDLHPGKHPVVLRGEGERGFGARLIISEQGKQSSYHTFTFDCGTPGHCAMTDLQDFMDSLSRYPRGLHDPCGSTKIRQVRYLTGRTPDQIHPDALELSLVVDVYQFAPEHASGDPACAQRF